MRRLVLIALVVAAVPTTGFTQELEFRPVETPERPPLISRSLDWDLTSSATLYAAAAADFALTRIAISKGATEANPILGQHWARQAAIMAGATVGVDLLARKLEREGQTGMARMFRWLSIGTHGVAISWNLGVIRD